MLNEPIQAPQAANADGDVLYARFLAGDEAAFEELVRLYRSGLMLFLTGMVGGHEDAEELLVDTFSVLAADGGRFQGRSSLKTYLFAIGRNLAAKQLRKRRVPPPAGGFAAAQGGVPEQQHPERIVLRAERDRQIYTALQSLNPDYRQVLYLLYFEEMSHADAGLVMKKSRKQIDNLAQRARAALKRVLESEGLGHENG